MNLRFSRRAVRDIERLHRFIAEKNPAASKRMQRRLLASIQILLDQPLAGHALDEIPIREWISDDVIVHYRASEDELLVLRLWHGKEDR